MEPRWLEVGAEQRVLILSRGEKVSCVVTRVVTRPSISIITLRHVPIIIVRYFNQAPAIHDHLPERSSIRVDLVEFDSGVQD